VTHVEVHTELEQTWPALQVMPHPPQLAPSVAVVAQYAGDPLGVQSSCPVAHCETQAPAVQI